MRHKRALLFLLTVAAVWLSTGQTDGITGAKPRTVTQVESHVQVAGPRASGRGISKSRKYRLVETYGKMPMRFEANQGQADANVKFLARGAGYRLFLTENESVIAMRKPLTIGSSSASETGNLASTSLRLRLLGANATPTVSGMEKLPGKTNYFLGNDPKQWRTEVPAFASVRYTGVYPGVDLIYHGRQSQLEFDFVAAAGADVSRITMEVTELRPNEKKGEMGDELRARIDSAGNLVLDAEDGRLVFHKPVAYQAKDSALGRAYVDARYVIKGKHQVGFEVGAHDARKAVIIDPILSYSTYLGGSQDDLGNAITVDASGSAYVTGGTTSSNFPVTSGVVQTTYGGADGGYQGVNGDIFVTKLSPDGSSLVWSTYIGGSGDDNAYSIAVDGTGVYLTGGTNSSDYPVTPGVYMPSSGGLTDVFVTKLDPTGSNLLYSTHIGVSVEGIRGFGIAVDGGGSVYVAGNAGPGFPTTPGAFQTSSIAFTSAFVMKLNPTATAADYSTFLSGGNSADVDYAESIAVDKNGSAYVTGYSGSSTFPVTAGAFQSSNAGTHDAFFTVLNSSGSALLYSTYLGGAGNDEGFRIAVDSAGMAYIAGMTASSNFPTSAGAFQTVYGGGASDAFIAKLDPTKSGSASLIYATYLGGSGDDNLIAFPWGILAVDSLGHAYVTGGTTSTNFPTVHPIQAQSGGGYDAYVAKINPTGTGLIYSTYLGGGADDIGRGIAVDGNGNAYVTGQTSSSDFSVTANPYQKVFQGSSDAFVSKLVPAAFATPTSLTFSSQAVGTTSTAQAFTLTNEQNTSLSIAITTAGDFAETDTCGSSLGPDLSCTISVTFTPAATGSRTGSVTIPGAPQSVSLVGTGTDFSIAAASGANCPSVGNCSTSAIIKAGQTASYNLQVAPKSGFSGTVALTCAGAPMSATCSVSPATVAVNGTSSSAFVVSVSNTSSALGIPFVRVPGIPGFPVAFGALVLLCLLAPFLVARKRIVRVAALVGLAVFVASLALSGCGGGAAPPTNATLTITGTSSGVTRTLPVNITINH